jgi:hypothetical protein
VHRTDLATIRRQKNQAAAPQTSNENKEYSTQLLISPSTANSHPVRPSSQRNTRPISIRAGSKQSQSDETECKSKKCKYSSFKKKKNA